MSITGKSGREFALAVLKCVPRVMLNNLRPNPGVKKHKRGRGQHGGDKHGAGNKGSGQRQNYMRPGYCTGSLPFYTRFSYEPYYKGHHLRREYPPISLKRLQLMIDTNRLDSSKPIDLAAIIRTGLYGLRLDSKHAGFQLTDEGADNFTAKINIEIQWAPESVIAAIERNGGVITTAFYDPLCLHALLNPEKLFLNSNPIPRRLLPPMDCLEYYSSAAFRGYLANPEEVSKERLVLAQKYGYDLPKIEDDPDYEMLMERKDPRQPFYGLHPGWVVNLRDKLIMKPKAEYLKKYYAS